MIFSPLGSVTVTVSELFAGILATLSASEPLFFIVRLVFEEVRVTFLVAPDLATVLTIPLLAIVTEGSAVKVGVGSAVAVGDGEGEALGVGEGVGAGVGTITTSTGYSDGFNTVITRRGTDPPR